MYCKYTELSAGEQKSMLHLNDQIGVEDGTAEKKGRSKGDPEGLLDVRFNGFAKGTAFEGRNEEGAGRRPEVGILLKLGLLEGNLLGWLSQR